MSVFCLLQVSVKDFVKIKEYTDVAPATVNPFGGELLFRSNVSDILSGKPNHTFAVVINFPDKAAAKGWYESADYQDLIEIRDAGADVVATLYDESEFF